MLNVEVKGKVVFVDNHYILIDNKHCDIWIYKKNSGYKVGDILHCTVKVADVVGFEDGRVNIYGDLVEVKYVKRRGQR